MKKLLIIFLILNFSCEKEGLYTHSTTWTLDLSNANLLYQSTFSPTSGITVQGDVKIVELNGIHYLQLVNFSITDGPDLKIYLSKNDYPSDFINLGALDSNTIKTLPSSINFNEYSYVLIHCQAYNHLFAIAQLN